jgi:uncharacterized protein YndB with AHSA1/START domain
MVPVPGARDATELVEREVLIEAEPETVFAFFTDPEKMVRWLGVSATLDPRPGGLFRVNPAPESTVEGNYVEVSPYSRLVFTWGYPRLPGFDQTPLPPGGSTVEVELLPEGGATRVRLTHLGPDALALFHRQGWANYLDRLAETAAGRDPGPDRFPGAWKRV